jgi:hypothetical protein
MDIGGTNGTDDGDEKSTESFGRKQRQCRQVRNRYDYRLKKGLK